MPELNDKHATLSVRNEDATYAQPSKIASKPLLGMHTRHMHTTVRQDRQLACWARDRKYLVLSMDMHDCMYLSAVLLEQAEASFIMHIPL